jgi:putative aminopeptidase FrvX
MSDLDGLIGAMRALAADVEQHVTRERVRRYLSALVNTQAPSTFAGPMRGPVLRRLLVEDGALPSERLHFQPDFARTGSPVILTGSPDITKPLWFFAHLDTISYLVRPEEDGRYPLTPFCAHMIVDGTRAAQAYRYDLFKNAFSVVAEGQLESVAGVPFFHPAPSAPPPRPGDRVVMVSTYREEPSSGVFTGSMDNAGGATALAVAAPVLARAGVEAMLAFPDEEEGPVAPGNQTIGRGGSRIVSLLPAPELAIVTDVQQAGGAPDADARGGAENSARLGAGAVLSEFSSLARGAVTPPDLYALARHASAALGDLGVKVQESNNAYSSRSDDVSVMLKTPNILLLGFPGFNRHFDRGEPRAHLDDVVHLAKALVYMSALRPLFTARRRALLEGER